MTSQRLRGYVDSLQTQRRAPNLRLPSAHRILRGLCTPPTFDTTCNIFDDDARLARPVYEPHDNRHRGRPCNPLARECSADRSTPSKNFSPAVGDHHTLRLQLQRSDPWKPVATCRHHRTFVGFDTGLAMQITRIRNSEGGVSPIDLEFRPAARRVQFLLRRPRDSSRQLRTL